MNSIQKIILWDAGVSTSNGEYTKAPENTLWFEGNIDKNTKEQIEQFGWYIGPNGNHIEPTIDGFFLWDFSQNEQTYMFDHSFTNCIPVGDAIFPSPKFSLIYNG